MIFTIIVLILIQFIITIEMSMVMPLAPIIANSYNINPSYISILNLGYALSGGERRRIEIARTIANNPSFILLDEPFAGVDPIAVEDIQNIIRHLKNRGLGILITDHNVRETLSIVDKAYIMANGKVLLSGNAKEIASSEEAKRIYLGENFKLD